MTFTTRRALRLHVNINNVLFPLKLKNMYSLMNKKSKFSAENKLTHYKAILKAVWTYGIELWG
jgi:hypothetical protein